MATKLEAFSQTHSIKPADLARTAEYSRQHLLRVRLGKQEPTRRCIKAITQACSALSRKKVKAADLFDLG
jgi:predicted transcriptional regulator